jgi:hypothetical protein
MDRVGNSERRILMKNLKIIWIVCALLCVPVSTLALPLNEVLETVANRLVEDQYKGMDNPELIGAWVGEEGYTGSILGGLVQAYQVKGEASYLEAANLAVEYILRSYGGNLYGDEAYALARLTEVTGDPYYANIVREFYEKLDTRAYIRGFNETHVEKATFFLSYHTLAAYMVDAKDKEIWRESILNYLCQVDDDIAYFPVMTLGVATWALAQTGPMDDTKIIMDPLGLPVASYWENVTLADLPDLLASHQVLSGENTGSFYIRFDHTPPSLGYDASGFTEDTVYGVLGLIAASNIEMTDDGEGNTDVTDDSNHPWNFDKEIQDARDILSVAVSPSGLVRAKIIDNHHYWGSDVYSLFGGELLLTLDE